MGAMEIIEENEKIVVLKDGKEVECDILSTFDSEDTGKSYIGYTDNSIASNGRKNIFVSSFDPIIGTGSFEDVTDPRELEMVQDVLMQIDEESSR